MTLANTLWLNARHTVEQVHAPRDAASHLDILIAQALQTGSDADATFVDAGLVRFIASGGTTSVYLRTHHAG